MLNSLNALSDESSLLSVGLFSNPVLLIAITISIVLHCGICYIPFFGDIFGTDPLSKNDWILVLMVSFPVMILDEIIKFIARRRSVKAQKERREREKKAD